jgi:hypothetical protein
MLTFFVSQDKVFDKPEEVDTSRPKETYINAAVK